jgi:uncharacterized protein YwqG
MTEADVDIDRRVTALLDRYRSPAILLHRIYAPQTAAQSGSFFGGLPALPPELEWPRTSGGVPLHFLCQIDCADIGWRTSLPAKGVLFFFGRDDEEQLWGEACPADDCRVLYAPDGSGLDPSIVPPEDLPPIGGDYPRSICGEIVGEGAVPSLHVKWPIEPLPMDSFPDKSGLPEVVRESDRSSRRFNREFRLRKFVRVFLPRMRMFPRPSGPSPDEQVWDRYEEILPIARASAFEDATGQEIWEQPELAFSGQQARRLFGDESFPQRWIFIHFFARAVLRRHRSSRRYDTPAPTAEELDEEARGEARLDEEAEAWLDRSHAGSLDAIPDADVRREFRDWAADIKRRPDDLSPGYHSLDWSRKAAAWAIRAWAGNAELANKIPPSVYECVGDLFRINSVQRGADGDWYSFQFAQMLGHAPASQESMPANDPEICLLNLASDSGIGWSFGDAGECSFWIDRDDLARCDFSRVRGTIEGH